MSTLTPNQKRYLRGLAHALKPIILMGSKGASEALLAELELALDHHELVKVRISAEDRQERQAIVTELVEKTRAALVQQIGNIACLYRRNPQATQPLSLPR